MKKVIMLFCLTVLPAFAVPGLADIDGEPTAMYAAIGASADSLPVEGGLATADVEYLTSELRAPSTETATTGAGVINAASQVALIRTNSASSLNAHSHRPPLFEVGWRT